MFPPFGREGLTSRKPPGEIEAEFFAFTKALRNATAVSSIHSVEAGARCLERYGTAVILVLHDWGQVDQAIRNVGTWLVANDLKGDVILWPQPIPGRIILL